MRTGEKLDQLNCTLHFFGRRDECESKFTTNLICWLHPDGHRKKLRVAITRRRKDPPWRRNGAFAEISEPLRSARRARTVTHSVLRPRTPTCTKTGTHWYTVRENRTNPTAIEARGAARKVSPVPTPSTHSRIFLALLPVRKDWRCPGLSPLHLLKQISPFGPILMFERHRMFHWVVWWRLGSTGWEEARNTWLGQEKIFVGLRWWRKTESHSFILLTWTVFTLDAGCWLRAQVASQRKFPRYVQASGKFSHSPSVLLVLSDSF